MIALKNMLFLIIVPGSVTVLAPWLLINWDSGLPVVELGLYGQLGWLLILAGAEMVVWSTGLFAFIGGGTPAPVDPPKEFVASGLYRYVRNPMYVGVLLALLGEFMIFGAAVLLIYAGVLFTAFHLFVVNYEEPTLSRKFGDIYDRYRETVPRWLPRIPSSRPSS